MSSDSPHIENNASNKGQQGVFNNSIFINVNDTPSDPALDIIEAVNQLCEKTFSIWASYGAAELYGHKTPYSRPLEWRHRAPLDHLRSKIQNAAERIRLYHPGLEDSVTKIQEACDGVLNFCPEGYELEDSTSSYLMYRNTLPERIAAFKEALRLS